MDDDPLKIPRDLIEQERFDVAVRVLEDRVRNYINFAEAMLLLAEVYQRQGDAKKASQWIRKAVNTAPNRADIQANAGQLQAAIGNHDEAMKRWQAAIAIEADHFDANLQFGLHCLDKLRRPSAAKYYLWAAHVKDVGSVHAMYHLAKACFQLGDVDLAMQFFMQCLMGDANADDAGLQFRALEALAIAIPGADLASNPRILEARREWALYAEPEQLPEASFPGRDRNPERPLTIGYVSSFFGSENWMKPVWGLINQHDRDRYPVRIFSFGPVPGCVEGQTAETAFRPHESDRIFDVAGLDNERVAQVMADEKVDVLIDLNGYSDTPRMGVLFERAAPVQIGWFNLYATTGTRSYDYLIGDRHVVLPEEEESYTEQILRVPGSYLTFAVGYPVPEVAASPCLTTKTITFGSLCSRYKLTPAVLDAWADIINMCPNSRLLLRNGGLEDPVERAAMHALCGEAGIPLDRLELLGRAPHYEFLQTYDRIDIALDTFPYNGGTTTTEAIWQGVPVIAFAGKTWASRTSATLLHEGNLADWVATDLEDYIGLAVRWGKDPEALEKLSELRRTMRDRLRASSVCNTAAFARDMEGLYRQAWRTWCATHEQP